MEIYQQHIENIRVGDTVMHEGVIKTVGKESIKYSDFMGRTLWGDSYRSGYKPVIVVKLT